MKKSLLFMVLLMFVGGLFIRNGLSAEAAKTGSSYSSEKLKKAVVDRHAKRDTITAAIYLQSQSKIPWKTCQKIATKMMNKLKASKKAYRFVSITGIKSYVKNVKKPRNAQTITYKFQLRAGSNGYFLADGFLLTLEEKVIGVF